MGPERPRPRKPPDSHRKAQRRQEGAARATPADPIFQLQHALGNRATQRLLQGAGDGPQEGRLPAGALGLGPPVRLSTEPGGHVALQREPRGRPAQGANPQGEAPKPIPWKEALRVLDVLTDLISPAQSADPQGIQLPGYRPPTSAALHAAIPSDVPARWRPLLERWWLIAKGEVHHPGGVVVSYSGDILDAQINQAIQETAPLVQELLAEGDATSTPWLAQNYYARIREFRARAAREAVTEAVERAAQKGVGGPLDVQGLGELERIKLGSSQALATISALMTVAQRMGGANDKMVKAVNAAYAEAVKAQQLPPGLQGTRAASLSLGLNYLQGSLRLVQTIANVADPDKRRQIYLQHAERFGPAAGTAEILKNLGQFVSGATAVSAAGTYAVAKALGKAELATKVLGLGNKVLGNINLALNVLGVIHGTIILLDENATTAEKAEAIVEVGSSGLGTTAGTASLLGQLGKMSAGRVAAISAPCAAASASLLITFHSYKAVLTHGAQAYYSLMAAGLNTCYAHMSREAKEISQQAMAYAAALDLVAVVKEPLRAKALAQEITARRDQLLTLSIKPFMARATRSQGASNRDPGAYEMLRRRFLPLAGLKLQTDDQVIAFVKLLLETIVGCFTDAQKVLHDEALWAWKHNG